MPDPKGDTHADQEALPTTPLHAYKDGRRSEVSGDSDALESNDPNAQQQGTLEGDDELSLPHEKK